MRASFQIPAAIAILVLIWGSTWAAIAVGLEGIPPWTGVAARFLLAAVLLAIVGWVRGLPMGGAPGLYRLWAIEAVFAFSISYGVVYWAEQWVPSGLTAILFATFPLFVALLAHPFLGERITPSSAAGVVAGFLGVAVIFSEDLKVLGGPEVRQAALVLLLSPAAAAISHVSVKRWGGGFHPMQLTVVPMAVTGVLMGVLAYLVERDRGVVVDLASVGSLAYLVVFGTAVTFTLYYWVLARVKATHLSLITFGIPVVAVAIGVLALGEPLTARTVAGAALVLVGVGLGRR